MNDRTRALWLGYGCVILSAVALPLLLHWPSPRWFLVHLCYICLRPRLTIATGHLIALGLLQDLLLHMPLGMHVFLYVALHQLLHSASLNQRTLKHPLEILPVVVAITVIYSCVLLLLFALTTGSLPILREIGLTALLTILCTPLLLWVYEKWFAASLNPASAPIRL